jgi:hypothetical protein
MRAEGSDDEEVDGVEVVEVLWREEGVDVWWRFMTKLEGPGPVYFTRSSRESVR